MKYFLLDIAPACTQAPRILSGNEELNRRDINLKNHSAIKNRMLFFIDSTQGTIFTGIVTQPFFLLSEAMHKITKQYEPAMPSKQVVLLGKENHISSLYYLPILPRIKAISDKSTLNNGRTKFIGNPVLKKSWLNNRHMLWLADFNSDLPIISLDLAESMLRRGARGLALTPVILE